MEVVEVLTRHWPLLAVIVMHRPFEWQQLESAQTQLLAGIFYCDRKEFGGLTLVSQRRQAPT